MMQLKGIILAAAFFMAAPLTANALVVTGDFLPSTTTSLTLNDVFTTEISDIDISDGPITLSFGFEATGSLLGIETSSLNALSDFTNPRVEWNSEADGSGTVFSFLAGNLDIALNELVTSFSSGETKWLIVSWDGVTSNDNNFDLKVAAVPIPASILMLLSGLLGLGFLGRYARRRAE